MGGSSNINNNKNKKDFVKNIISNSNINHISNTNQDYKKVNNKQ